MTDTDPEDITMTQAPNPTFYLDGYEIDPDRLGEPRAYLYQVNGVWKRHDDLTGDDIEALYYSGHAEVHLKRNFGRRQK